MKVADLKRLIRECVSQSVVELKEEFEHIELKKKGSLAGQKPTVSDGVNARPVDSGDRKQKVEGQPMKKPVVNRTSKVKEQKGAVNETVEHKGRQPLANKPVNVVAKMGAEKTGAMKEANRIADKDQKVMGETVEPAECANGVCPTCGRPQGVRPVRGARPARPVKEDVSVEVPLPAGSEGAEVSAEIKGEGDEQVAELIIVDDQVKPEDVSRDTIEIEVPGEGEDMELEVEDDMPAVGGEQPPMELPAPEGEVEAPEGQEDEDDFGRMADLAGLK